MESLISGVLPRSPKHFNYKLGSSILKETDGHHYLGVVYITNNLTWNKHIHQITSKTNQTLGFITCNLYSCPQQTKEAAYRTLVRPLVEYSSAVWDPYTYIQHCMDLQLAVDPYKRRVLFESMD